MYWELRDRMQANFEKLDITSLAGYAKELGLERSWRGTGPIVHASLNFAHHGFPGSG